jgi:hypothetical protein
MLDTHRDPSSRKGAFQCYTISKAEGQGRLERRQEIADEGILF